MRARDETDSPEMRLALPDDFGASPVERYHIVTIDALQVYGGYGYIEEFPAARRMRDAKA